MNYIILLILAICILTNTVAIANDNSISCSNAQNGGTNGMVTAGNTLYITATIVNSDCNNPITVADTMVGLVGNSGGTLGMQGPFYTSFNSSIPAANCAANPINGSENINLQIKVPATMKGTVIAAVGGIMGTQNGQNIVKMAGPCIVKVQ